MSRAHQPRDNVASAARSQCLLLTEAVSKHPRRACGVNRQALRPAAAWPLVPGELPPPSILLRDAFSRGEGRQDGPTLALPVRSETDADHSLRHG